MKLTITILGSGTSAGVPMIGCQCAVCTSVDARDKRTRPSIALHYGGHSVLVDTTPELRLQAIATGLHRIDAVVYTHAHADHIFGLDDVRRYNTVLGAPLPLYAGAEAMATIKRSFPYAFERVERTADALYRPELLPTVIEGQFDLFGERWTPIELPHGKLKVMGFRVGDFAYCTDCNDIPAEARPLLQGLDVLIIDALRPKPHPTHLSFEEALGIIGELKPKRAFFTHMSHDVGHADLEAWLPGHVRPLQDGLVIEVG